MINKFHRPFKGMDSRGFTLVEMLVAMGIFVTLMSGILMLFVGSIRTVNQGRQSINAHEMIRGAQMVFQSDITSGFTARDHSDAYNLVGTPIGTVLITTDRGNATSSANDASVPGLARITYAIYKNNITNWVAPVAATSTPGTTTLSSVDAVENIFSTAPFDPAVEPTLSGTPYKLIRFVEPGVSQLDTFPINWDFPVPDGITLKDGTVVPSNWTLGDLLSHYESTLVASGGDIDDFCAEFTYPLPDNATLHQALVIDFWLRMLAGGDTVVPVSAWWNENPIQTTVGTPITVPVLTTSTNLPIYNDAPYRHEFEARDYVLCEGVASPVAFDAKNEDVFEEGSNDASFYENQVFSYRPANVTYSAPDYVPTWWNNPVLELLSLQKKWQVISATFGDPPNTSDPDYIIAHDEMQERADNLKARLNATTANGLQTTRLPSTVTMKIRLALPSTTTNAPDFNREFNVEVNIPSAQVRRAQVTPIP